MRKKIFTSFLVVLVMSMFIAVAFQPTEATTYKFTATNGIVNLNGFGHFYRVTFQSTGATGQQDTLLINLPVTPPQRIVPPDTMLYTVNVYTADSAVIGVRYQQCSDNTTWQSWTIGTDSTSWYPGAYDAGTTIALHSFNISAPQYYGCQPYARIMIVGYKSGGRALYGWVGKIKVDIVPVHQN